MSLIEERSKIYPKTLRLLELIYAIEDGKNGGLFNKRLEALYEQEALGILKEVDKYEDAIIKALAPRRLRLYVKYKKKLMGN